LLKGTVSLSLCLCVCLLSLSLSNSACKNSAPNGRNFMKVYICGFLQYLSRRFNFDSNLTRKWDTLHEDLLTFIIICRWILLRMRNVPDKVVQKIKAHILCSTIFCSENRSFYDIMWKIWYSHTHHIWEHNITWNKCALHPG